MKQTFKFIDLFAGIGGLRLPFDEIGGQCVFSSEWDKFAQQTYAANFGHSPAGDITEIPPSDIPSFDLMLAGFPCQPFSHAGLRKGLEEKRGQLFYSIAEIAAHHQPKVILLENVKGLLTHDKGNTITTIRGILTKELGYKVFEKVLNAKDFGLPQNRERIFLVCLKGDENFEFPKPFCEPTKLGNILDCSVAEKYTISDRLWESHRARKQRHLEKGNGFGYRLFTSESSYTSTISARYYKDGAEILIDQAPLNPRKLTPREAARLQGFPETFQIPVSDPQAYKQFGNSVAVPVIRALAEQLRPILISTRS